MENLSDVELLNDLITDCIHCECSVATIRGKRKKLLSRLARGRKAIESMGKAINCRETFLKSEMSVLGDLDMAADNFASSIHKIIEGYQQTEEAADGD